MKSAGADRLDLGAQTVDGVAMDPREQRAIAPLALALGAGAPAPRLRSLHSLAAPPARSVPLEAKMSAQHDAFGFERQQRGVDVADGDGERSPPGPSAVAGPTMVRRPRTSSTSASARVHARARDGGGDDRRIERSRSDATASSSGSRSVGDQAAARARGASARRQAARAMPAAIGAASGLRQEPGGHQRVVQLVGVARIGTLLLAHALDRGGVERAEIVRADPAPRRVCTAWLRRSSSGASSRNA